MLAVAELAAHIGLQSACRAFALNRGFVYRVRAGIAGARHGVLCVLDSERFADVAPATVFATLLDEGQYVGSIRTMYRLLGAHGQNPPSSSRPAAEFEAKSRRCEHRTGGVLSCTWRTGARHQRRVGPKAADRGGRAGLTRRTFTRRTSRPELPAWRA